MTNKILVFTAILAVMVSMTGIGAAVPGSLQLLDQDVVDCGGAIATVDQLAPTNSITYDLKAIALGNSVQDWDLSVLTSNADLTITFPTGTDFPTTSGSFCRPDSVTVTVNPGASLGIKGFSIGAGPASITGELIVASNTINVPEFPTVALPVAAVIGLVFLFQQKKRKQE